MKLNDITIGQLVKVIDLKTFTVGPDYDLAIVVGTATWKQGREVVICVNASGRHAHLPEQLRSVT